MKYLYLTRKHHPNILRVEVVELAPKYVRVRLPGLKQTRRESWLTIHHEYHTEYAEAKRVLLFDLNAKLMAAMKEADSLHAHWQAVNNQTEKDFDK